MMKALKITIVAVLVAALGFGLYKIIANHIDKPDDGKIIIPEGCDLEWDQNYIDSAYSAIPYGQFKTLKQRRQEMQGNYDRKMSDYPPQCQATVELILRNRYQSRFIQMADHEFEGSDWPNYSDIRDMNAALLKELSQGSNDLKRIESVCKEYGQVLYYNSLVKKQCSQRPTTVSDHWDFSNTRNLLGRTPTTSARVDHTTQYSLSRLDNVKDRLYNGHVAFLDALVNLAESEIDKNPTRSNYNRVSDIVAKEIEKFDKDAASLYSKNYYTFVDSKAKQANSRLDEFKKKIKDDE